MRGKVSFAHRPVASAAWPSRGRRAVLCLALTALLLPLPVAAEPLTPPGMARILPADDPGPAAVPKAVVPRSRAESLRASTRTLGPLPPAFVENQGQADARAKLYLRSGRQTLWLTNEGVVFDLLRTVMGARAPTARRPRLTQERPVFVQEFVGASQTLPFLGSSC